MNPLMWAVSGWAWSQALIPLVLLLGLSNGGVSSPVMLVCSVGLGLLGMWIGLFACGADANRKSYSNNALLLFLFWWAITLASCLAATTFLGLHWWAAVVAWGLSALMGFWLLGESYMSPFVLLVVLGVGSLYLFWGLSVAGAGGTALIKGEAFLGAVLLLQGMLLRCARYWGAPPAPAASRDPFSKRY